MTTTMAGRFEAADLVRARRRFDAPPVIDDDAGARTSTRAAEVCAARRRFDGALGREGSGGPESFQPKFSRGVLGIATGARLHATPAPPRLARALTPPPPVAVNCSTPPPPFDAQRVAVVPTEVVIGPRSAAVVVGSAGRDAAGGFDDVVARIRTLGALRNEGLISDGEYQRKKDELLARI